ncbi:MAG: hypothetical protein HZA93_17730 [Verrucomicrobia bacterium]|nr:hypothetical protein [Verrucomicrobiota bacterium]
MTSETIVSALLRAASVLKKPVENLAAQGLKDLYAAAKARFQGKLSGKPDAVDALEKATEKPESPARKAVLIEEIAETKFEDDLELMHLLQHLAKMLPPAEPTIRQDVRVKGRGHRVQVAARDIINTEKHVHKNAITPDERHLSGEQKDRLEPLINELATRLAGEDGKPNYKKVHRMLQRQFNKSSYLLIERGDFDKAAAFLKEQRAINRSRLRSRNPVAYKNDFFRGIWSRARELDWEKPQVYEFALEKLALKKSLSSLKELGPIQLKTLSEAMQREVRKTRAADKRPGASADTPPQS